MHTEGQGFESLQFHYGRVVLDAVTVENPQGCLEFDSPHVHFQICRLSSVGRAFGLHPKGREFKSLSLYAAEWVVFAISVDKGFMYNKITEVKFLSKRKCPTDDIKLSRIFSRQRIYV